MARLATNHGIKGKRTQFSPLGITFVNKPKDNLSELDEFKKGLFEVQDEASQLVALQVDCLVVRDCDPEACSDLARQPGPRLLRRSRRKDPGLRPVHEGQLALTQNLGQIYVHDIRQSALTEAKKRINRSGMSNVQFHSDEKTLVKMAGKMDWVILDVPCSGSLG